MVKQTARVIGGVQNVGDQPAGQDETPAEATAFIEPPGEPGPPGPPMGRVALFALVWVSLVVALAAGEHGGDMLGPAFWLSGSGVTLVLQAALPVLLVVAMGKFEVRLRTLSAQSDDTLAMMTRIAEPEPVSSRNIVSIRHAMRKELAALNDHLDRSLNKTGEIEAAIKREVGMLEHSFADNERRMLGLVQELARQRETVVATTEQVRDVVRANRETLNVELASLATQVLEAGNYARGAVEEVGNELRSEMAAQGSDFAEMLRQVVSERIEPVSEMLGAHVQSLDALLSDGNGGVIAAFEAHGKDLVTRLDTTWGRISSDLASRSKMVEDVAGRLVGVIDESLESSVNKLENRIKSASLEIVGVLDGATEQAAQKIVEVGSASGDDLDARIEALSTRIDSHVLRFGELVQGAADRLVPALETQGNTLERAIKLQGAFEQSTTQLNAVLTQKAGEFVETLSHSLKTFQTQLGDRSSAITDELAAKLDRTVDRLEEGSRRFGTTLLNVQDTISVASDRLTVSAAEYNADFAQRIGQIETLLADGSDRMGERLTHSTANLAAALTDGVRSVEVTFEGWAGRIGNIVSDGLERSDSALGARIAEFTLLESSRREQLQTVLDDAAASITLRLSDGVEALAATAEQARSEMDEVTGRLGGELRTLWVKFAGELGSLTSAARSSLVDASSESFAALDSQMQQVGGALQTQLGAIYGSLDARTRELEANITQFGSNIDTQTSRLSRVIGQKSEAIEQEIEQGLESFESALSAHLKRAEAAVATLTQEEAALFASQIETLDQALDNQSVDLGARIDRVRGLLDTRSRILEAQIDQFGSGIEDQTARIEGTMAQKSELLVSSIDGGARQIEAVLTSHIDRFDAASKQFIDEETTRFDRQIDVLGRTLDSRSEILDSIMRTRGADFTDKLHASSRRFEEGLAEQARVVDSSVRAAGTELQSLLADQASEMQRRFDAALEKTYAQTAEHVADVDARLADVSNRLGGSIDEKSTALISALDERTAELDRALSSGSGRIGALLERETDRLNEQLAHAAGQVAGPLAASVSAVGTQLREQAQSVAAAVEEGSNRIDAALERAAAELERSARDRAHQVQANLDKSLDAAVELLVGGAEATQKQVAASVDGLLGRLATHERNAVARMESAAANVGESTRKAAELTAERLVTLNGAVVQVLNSLGASRAPARRPKLGALPDAAE